MKTINITGEELKAIGYPEGKMIGLAIRTVEAHYQNVEKEKVLALLLKAKDYPENCLDDEALGPLAKAFQKERERIELSKNDLVLKQNSDPYAVFGKDFIEQGA